MSRSRFVSLLVLVLAGCGQEAPKPNVVVEKPVPKVEPAKIEPKPLPKKVEEPSFKPVRIDLRADGLFAIVDAPDQTRIDRTGGKFLIVAGDEGVELLEGAVDLAALKKEWMKSELFKLSELPIDEPDALLAEVETTGKKRLLLRINVAIGGKEYHMVEYFAPERMTVERAKRLAGWARTLRQTADLKKAQEQAATARNELKKLGALFPSATTVSLVNLSRVDEPVFELLTAIPTLQAISFENCEQLSVSGIVSLEALTRLRSLSITSSGLTFPIVTALGNLSQLESLTLNGPAVVDTWLKPLASLRKLTALNLARSRVSDRGLVHLQPLTNLVSLNLEGTDVSSAGLALLKEFQQLKSLNLTDTMVDDAGVKNLLELPNLAELNLSETNLSETGLQALAEHSKVQWVNVQGTNVMTAGLEKLKGASNARLFKTGTIVFKPDVEKTPEPVVPPVAIDKLPPADLEAMVTKFGGKLTRNEEADDKPIIGVDLHGSQVADVDLGQLRQAPQLQKLNLENCPNITDAGLPYLAVATALEEIDLRSTRVAGDGLAHLKGLTRLTRLLLAPKTPLTRPQINFLADLPNLETLTFTVAEPAYPRLQALSRLSKLKELNLDGVTLSNRKMSLLKYFKELESLTLGSQGVLGDRGLQALKGMPNLKSLVIRHYTGSDEGLEALRSLEHLESLDLNGPQIRDRGIGYVGGCSKLKYLKLERLKITDSGLSSLRSLSDLIAIRLAHTGITDRGLGALAELKDLELIDLSDTKVTDAGLAKLKDLEELKDLILNGNEITGTGFKALEGLTRLYRVSLAGAKVNDAGLAAIARIAPLQALDLSQNPVTSVGISSLRSLRMLERINFAHCELLNDEAVAALKNLVGLKRVNLMGCKLSAPAIDELRKAMIQVDDMP